MKLTNYLRDAFVKAAMNDVPQVDYEQQIRDLVEKKRKATLKPLGLDKTDIKRLQQTWVQMPGSIPNMYLHGITTEEGQVIAADLQIKELAVLHEAQSEQRSKLETKLEGIAQSCTTRKQLVELMPEFEKYLPAEEAKVRNLPAISNVIGDFVRAGWPKNKQAAA